MTSDDELRRIFEETAALKARDSRDQLAYRHMIALAARFKTTARSGGPNAVLHNHRGYGVARLLQPLPGRSR